MLFNELRPNQIFKCNNEIYIAINGNLNQPNLDCNSYSINLFTGQMRFFWFEKNPKVEPITLCEAQYFNENQDFGVYYC